MLALVNSIAEIQSPSAVGPEIFSNPESFYRTALESLSEGVMILDSDCRILYANQLVSEITVYSPDELLGQTPHLFLADPNNSPCKDGPPKEGDPWSFQFEMK